MLTPRFSVEQDDDFVTVRMHTPYIKAAGADFFIEGDMFQCHVKPYFLRLRLPGRVLEDGRESAQYDVDKGEMVVRLPKETKGETFADLDLHTKLLATSSEANKKKDKGPLIQVVGESVDPAEAKEENESEEEEDWELPQEVPSIEKPIWGGAPYGFNNQVTGFVTELGDELFDVVLIADADRLSEAERRVQRVKDEDEKFDQEYYMADTADWTTTHELISYKTKWNEMYQSKCKHDESAKKQSNLAKTTSSPVPPSTVSTQPPPVFLEKFNQTSISDGGGGTFTFKFDLKPPVATDDSPDDTKQSAAPMFKFVLPVESTPIATVPDATIYQLTTEELDRLRDLPKREYLISDPKPVYLGLVDLLFAYLYDVRTTESEHTSESAWTINRLSAMLSCLDSCRSPLREIVVTCYRRALAYPLYRKWKLCVCVHRDVVEILHLGRRAVLSCLLAIKHIIERDEQRHYLGRLYIDDYCVWIQHASDAKIASLAADLAKIRLAKSELGFSIDALESAL